MAAKPIILRDVAQSAGVSLRTASRVLNEDPNVADATRQRVLSVMEELSYTPDAMARSLRAGTDATIGLVVESVADPFFGELAEAVEAAADDDGRSVLIGSTRQDPARERTLVEQMLQRRVSGLLLVPTSGSHDWLDRLATATPVVMVDRPAQGIDADVVRVDDREATAKATRHLIAQGHRTIAYVGDFPTVSTSADRLEGFLLAMAEHGIEVPDAWVRASCPTPEEASAATSDVIATTSPTAILSAATRCSLGVVPALHALRRTDIALVGFGDFAMADSLQPGITVIDHSARAVAVSAVARLMSRLSRPDMPTEVTYVPVRLVERGSGELRP
ncbi:LacI family DNA-binding transcriptional regulator [Acidothermaceae bacterium B102]|nr:LacI family DNA-binding transcriptional regulator [Acidothermaceae bacterium B102]